MEIERIEAWIGQEVVDVGGKKVGKLEEIYFRGSEPVLGEVKPGALARKRLLVPLLGATASRDYVRLSLPAEKLLQEDAGGTGPSLKDLDAITEAYGAGFAPSSGELESWTAREQRRQAAAADVEAAAEARAAAIRDPQP